MASFLRVVQACLAVMIASQSALADPTITVSAAPGPNLTVQVALSGLSDHPAAGYQIILAYDPAQFVFISGQYMTGSFGLPLLNPISASGGTVRLAAGINTFIGQPPVSADAIVALLSFMPTDSSCVPQVLIMPDSLPPTRLSDAAGQPILPLHLVSLERGCIADYDDNGLVQVPDIFAFLSDWFAGSCRADIDGGGLGVPDIFAFLSSWFFQCL